MEIIYKLKDERYEKGDEFIDKFLPYWSKFQEEWDEEMWDQYNYYRDFDLEQRSQINYSIINEDNKKPPFNRFETQNNQNLHELKIGNEQSKIFINYL